jgi:hypothetical protein
MRDASSPREGTGSASRGWLNTVHIHFKEHAMITVKSLRDGLAGSAAVALIAVACAWPAAAQTTTTPTVDGANCGAAGASQQNCANNQNNSSATQPNSVTLPGSGTSTNSNNSGSGAQPGTTPPPSNSGSTNSTGGAVGPSTGTTSGGGSGGSSGTGSSN